jgi:uncharacterized membrane protein
MKPRLPRWTKEISWRVVAAALLFGGIVHISATLAVPWVGANTDLQKLHEGLPVHRMVVLPPPTPGAQILPFLAPDTMLAVCRYDLKQGPVMISATLRDVGWALSLHSPQGDNFYALPAQQLRRSEVSFLLLPPSEAASTLVPGSRRPTMDATHIEAPTNEGLVVVRAPLKGLAWRAEAAAALSRAKCTPTGRQG